MSTIIYTCNGQVLVDVSDNKWLAEPLYTVTYSTVSNGTISGQATAHAGDTVTVTATADTGYELDYITVNGVAIVGNTFTMPNSNVTISAVFVQAAVEEVTIGTQTWKTSNMAIDDAQGGIMTVNGNVYYTQEAAIRVAATVNGWHLPTVTEFYTLMSNIGGSSNGRKLASTSGWSSMQGTDDYGFNALPVGYCNNYTQIEGVGEDASFWTSTVVDRSADFGFTYLVKRGFIVHYTYDEYTGRVNGFECSTYDTEYYIDYGEIETNGPKYVSVRLIKDS